MYPTVVTAAGKTMRRAAMALALALAGLTPAPALESDSDLLKMGEQLLEKRCQRCHAIRSNDKSSHFKAPPFRDVVNRYPAGNIAEALAEGIITGHPDMPELAFEPAEINAIVTYLDSLSTAHKN
jgi:cytochrome c